MEKVIKAIQDEYPDDFAWCYGCGRLNQERLSFSDRMARRKNHYPLYT